MHVGVLGDEVDEHRRQHPGRDRRQRRDDDAPVLAAAVRREPVDRVVDTVEQVGHDVEGSAVRRQRDRPRRAREQLDADGAFELADRAAHDRLAHVEILGGTGERGSARDGPEHLEMAQAFHA